jgi:GT2 family glycosyltransferase
MEEIRAVPPYSACIVNHEGAAVLPATLQAVFALEPAPEEVILVDNASQDDGIELARRLAPHLRLVRLPSNAGPGPARDAGYRAARHARVLFIDNDVRPDPCCAAALSRALDGQPTAALAMARICHAHAPATIQFDGAAAHALGMMALDHAETPLAAAPGEVREIGSIVTACFMVDRQRWGEEPLCDPAFFFHFEDHELGLRARLLGWRLLSVPSALALHGKGTPGISLRATGRFTEVRVYHTIRNRWQVILKFYEARTLAALAPALLLFELFQLAGALRRGWAGHYWRAASWLVANHRDLRERRRRIQGRRRLADTAVLSGGPPPFAAALLTSPLERAAAGLLARMVEANWALASRLLGNGARAR